MHNNCWYIYIDIECPELKSYIQLQSNVAINNEFNLEVNFDLSIEKLAEIYNKAIAEIEDLLNSNNVNYIKLNSEFSISKIEDTYHPFAMALSELNILNVYEYLFLINTGILPRARGINITAALFLLIEYYLD